MSKLAQVWAALDELSDPEIPVLTLRDLEVEAFRWEK